MTQMQRFRLRLVGWIETHCMGWRTFAASMVMIHLAAHPAQAQVPAALPGDDGGMLQWGVAAGITVVICLAGFLNPKRSHLH